MANILEEVGLGLVMEFRTVGSEIFKGITEAFSGIEKEIAGANGAAAGMVPAFKAAGTAAAVGLGAVGLVAAGISIYAIKAAGDFQELTTQLVTGAGESHTAIEEVRTGILALAPAVGVSATELAKGLYNIESAGYHGAEGLEVLRVAAQGAKVGAADMAVVADAVTTALNDYHLPASAAVAVTNDLVATVASGKMHMDDLAGSLSKVLPVAAALGVSFPEVSAAIATMTSQGTNAAMATTSLRFLMAALAGPTKAAAKEFEGLGLGMDEIPGITAATKAALADIGIETSAVADTLAHGGIQAALDQITEALGKKFPIGSAAYEAALKGAVGGTRGLTAALELTGSHTDTFAKNIEHITAASKNAGHDVEGWSEVQADLNHKLEQWHATVEALTITLGTKLLPTATRFIDWINTNAVPALTSIIEFSQRWGFILGPLAIALTAVTVALAAFAIGSAIATTATAAWGVALIVATSPVTLIILAIVALIAAGVFLYQHWDVVKEKAAQAWGWIADRFTEAKNAIGAALLQLSGWFADRWADIQNTAVSALHAVVDGLRWLYDHNYYVKDTVDFIVGAWHLVHDTTVMVWTAVSTFFGGFFSGLGTIVHGAIDAVVAFMSGKWDDAVTGIRTFLSNAGKAFGDLKEWIMAPLRDAGTWLLDVGKSMMQGLINGIKSMAGAVWAAIKSAVGSFAAGALTDLGFHSDVPGYADGIAGAPGGFAMVGERGPELMYVPRGASVYPTGTGPRGGGGGSMNVTVQVVGMGVTNEVAGEVGRVAANEIMRAIRYGS